MPDIMTDKEIAELRALEAKATPGPWVAETMRPHTLGLAWVSNPGVADHIASCAELVAWSDKYKGYVERADEDQVEDNAAFIAAARNAVPRLLATVEHLTARAKTAERERDEARAETERLRAALIAIASFDDERADSRLEATGSYGGFDEPGSVQAARAAIKGGSADA